MIRKFLFHNFIIIYRISQWLRRHLTPGGTLLLSGLVAAAVFGLDTRQTLSYQIFALLFSLFFIGLLAGSIFRGKFHVSRVLPQYGAAGQPLQYEITVNNYGTRNLHNLTIIDELANDFPDYRQYISATDVFDKKRNLFDRLVGYPRLVSLIRKFRGGFIRPVFLDTIFAGETIRKKIELMPVRRGYLHFSRTLIGRCDPFGLVQRFKHYDHRDSILVLPRLYDMPPIHLTGARKYQHGGMTLASSVGDSEEFFSLRDYRPGDPMRAIHWKSYAKRGMPIVKEYQDEYFSRLGLVLDTFLENQPDTLFEEAVSVAASIATSSHQQDSLLDLIFINDKAYRFTAGRGLAGTDNLLEILACVERNHTDDFDSLIHMLMQHSESASGFICVLLGWDEKRRQLVRQLMDMGHPVMVFVISDPENKNNTGDAVFAQTGNFRLLQPGKIQQTLNTAMGPAGHA